jgi:hypothetical protein
MRWLPLTVLLLAGCGYVGDPLPPSLLIPSPVEDLRAREIGERIVIEFTVSGESTDGVILKSLAGMELRVGPTRGGDFDAGIWEQESRVYEIARSLPGAVTFEVPARDWARQEVAIAVRTRGPKGRASSWSNYAVLTVIDPLAAPVDVTATPVAEGVRVTWKGPAGSYRVFRSQDGAEPQPMGESETMEFLDTATVYEVEYEYRVQQFRGGAVSEFSAVARVKPEDVFAPASPEGLTAIVTPASIELSWEPVSAADLRGYRVYRGLGDGPFEPLSDQLTAPAYSDRTIRSGQRYRYAVTSVDRAGNESARSAPAIATAQ